jgi:hypothetical protein
MNIQRDEREYERHRAAIILGRYADKKDLEYYLDNHYEPFFERIANIVMDNPNNREYADLLKRMLEEFAPTIDEKFDRIKTGTRREQRMINERDQRRGKSASKKAYGKKKKRSKISKSSKISKRRK